LVIYITKRGKCPAILEVTGAPHWDPDRIDRDDRPGEGDRWGVVTPVRGLYGLALNDAPPVELIGRTRSELGRKGHVTLEEWQYLEAERLLAGRRGGRRKSPSARDVSIEAGHVEGYDVTPPSEARRAYRREASLVRDYANQLQAQGDQVVRKEIQVPGSRSPIFSDIFNKTRNQLIEAKAGSARDDVRMAIGQLADYGRFVPGSRRAVLLNAKPHPDLVRLLRSQRIATIWRERHHFADNAGGDFV
jgi:hypothetical protein